jgi:hypothetical protein
VVSGADLEAVRRSYRAAFQRFLGTGDEAALHEAYRIGRTAVERGLTVPDLSWIHHEILVEVLTDGFGSDPVAVAHAASELLGEALSVFEMTRR